MYTANCDFGAVTSYTGGFCGYIQPPRASETWQLKNGRTLSPDTGPRSGYGGQGVAVFQSKTQVTYRKSLMCVVYVLGWYAYVSSGTNGKAELISPWLTYNDSYNCRLYVARHMYGVDVQNLTFTFERIKWTPVGYEIYNTKTFRTFLGNRGDRWIRATSTLPFYLGGQRQAPFRIRFAASVINRPYGEIAIDSIQFGACPGTGNTRGE